MMSSRFYIRFWLLFAFEADELIPQMMYEMSLLFVQKWKENISWNVLHLHIEMDGRDWTWLEDILVEEYHDD